MLNAVAWSLVGDRADLVVALEDEDTPGRLLPNPHLEVLPANMELASGEALVAAEEVSVEASEATAGASGAVAALATKEEVVGLVDGKAIRADLLLPMPPAAPVGEVATEEAGAMTTDATDMELRENPVALQEVTETLSADEIVDTKNATETETATEIVIVIVTGTDMAEAETGAGTETEAEADATTTTGQGSDTTTMMGTTTRDKDGDIEL